jgi:hypothetical protein
MIPTEQNNKIIEIEAQIAAYEAGCEASWQGYDCLFVAGSIEKQMWDQEFRDAKADRNRKNKVLRSLRLRAARLRGTHTKEEWNNLVNEFSGRCVRCGRSGYHLDKDHIIPVYQGGSDSIDNLQPLCAWCNAAKGPEDINWVALRRQKGFL